MHRKSLMSHYVQLTANLMVYLKTNCHARKLTLYGHYPLTLSGAVILGLKETEERYYLLVKEPKRHREASMNCKLRGGILTMPKNSNTNRLMADYVSQAGLTRVYIGVQTHSKEAVSGLHQNMQGGLLVFLS